MNSRTWYKSVVVTLSAIIITSISFAQQKDVLITIGNDKISKQEFENVYRKNNAKQAKADEKTLREYLDLYINFRLKVKEAEALGLDTVGSFEKELAGYRKQLAAPYLTDKEVTEKLIREAYERSQKEIRASHILITCKEDASPKDTLAAYTKVMNIRKRVADKKEDFAKVAEQTSDDPSVKTNKGDLGYFSAFSMVYPFESACYNAKPGQVTMPVRTRYGYHIIKVTDVRPAQGEVKVAHIMIRTTPQTSKEDSLKAIARIEELYNKLKAGEKFDDLAKQYSEDKNSGKTGGVLPMFGTGKMVPEFETASFALKNIGDYSQPFKTAYGWHIVKLLERKTPASFEDARAEIKNKVGRDSRADLNKQSFIKKLKSEYKYTENVKVKDALFKRPDSTFYMENVKFKDVATPDAVLFTMDGKNYLVKDFTRFVEHGLPPLKAAYAINKTNLYNQYVDKTIVEYEESRLSEKYPEFKALMQEYRDGILLFELTDEKVWSAAVKDSIGLQKYFSDNNKNYMWGERLNATVYTCKNETIANDVRKLLKNKKINEDSLMRRVNKDNPLNLTIKSDKFEKGDNAVIDGIEWKKGITKNMNVNNTVVFVDVKEKMVAQPKQLSEVRGAATADYQNYLEKNWIASLKAKYPVAVNEEVFKSIVRQ
jgi:peptidyl-prolyl cis-trans isomerase SurA